MLNLDELDKLAAEKIMGYIREQDYWLQAGINGAIVDWSPTRNITQAFELLDKFPPLHFKLEQRGTANNNWICNLVGQDAHGRDIADTAPLAITKACLRAGGVEL